MKKSILLITLALNCMLLSAQQADLMISKQSATPNPVVAGELFTVETTISNIGKTAASATTVLYYLSADSILGGSYNLLGSGSASSVAIDGSIIVTKSVTIPSYMTDGSYYIVVVADGYSQITESDETNNTKGTAFTVGKAQTEFPDLGIQDPMLESSIFNAGDMMTIGCSASNNGPVAVSSSAISFYLSQDTIYDVNDVMLGDSPFSNLAAYNLTNYSYTNVELPTNTLSGNWYILCYVDADNSVVESDESNNLQYIPIKVNGVSLPDLVIINPMSSATSIAAGASTYIGCQIKNNGNVEAASSKSYFEAYLSNDMVYDIDDVNLSQTLSNTITVGGTQDIFNSITIPSGTTAGTKYILFIADFNDGIIESNENNNTGYVQVTITGGSQLPDLTINNAKSVLDTIAAGGTTQLNCRVNNIGQGNATSSYNYVYYYFSSDTILNTSYDTYLAASSINNLTAGSYLDLTVNATLPTTATQGTQYILFIADGYNYVSESNENNNVSYYKINVTPPVLSDLIVQNPTLSVSTIESGNTVDVSCIMKNQGAGSASYPYVYYYLSTDSIYDYGDTYINYSYAGSSLASGASTSILSSTLTIPSNTITGNYYILYYADGYNEITESNENNNIKNLPITITAGLQPDLTVINPMASPNTVAAGGTTQLSCRVSNIGEGNATSSNNYLYYYLSSDSILNTSYDTYITSSSLNTITAGSYQDVSVNATLSTSATQGTQYILFVADGYNYVSESNENNNVGYYRITVTPAVLPDLIIQSPTLSASTVAAGNTVDVTCILKNQGLGSASYPYVYYYLSSDSTYAGSYINYSYGGSSLAAGISTSLLSSTLTIPSNTKAGNYYILYYADGYDEITESNENNNIKVIPITITAGVQPDLTVINPMASPNSVAAGSSTQLSCRVNNIGEGSATSNYNYVYYYLSSDSILNTSYDSYLTASSLNTIAAGGYQDVTVNATLSTSATQGTQYILFVADGYNYVSESDENNNVSYYRITVTAPVLPDLIIQSPTLATSTIVAGNTANVSCVMKNQGTGIASYPYVYYYLSSDSIYNSGDTYINYSYAGSSLAAGASTSILSSTLTIPSNTITGNYYILYYADGYNEITESNENNNIKNLPITITAGLQPDLTVINPMASPNTVAAGSTTQLSCRVSNIGEGNATSSYNYLYYYLSSDSILNTSYDTYLTSSSLNNITAGTYQDVTVNASLSSSATQGTQYILFVADGYNYVSESNENNNVGYYRITVTAPVQPDLIIQSPTLTTSTVAAGSAASVGCVMKNQGLGSASSPYVYYYLSTDSIYNSGDTYINYSYGGSSLAAGASSSLLSANLTIPLTTSVGTYYILYYADGYNEITESNENNNVKYLPITITAPELPDLTVQTPTATPTTIVAGASTSVSCSIANIGLGNATSSTYLYYYLSSDTTYQYAEDVSLEYNYINAINAGAKASSSKSITIPSNIVGKWYIILQADAGNYILEKNENNNTKAISITVTAPKLPDLIVNSTIVTPDTINAGKSITASCSVKNQGELAASSATTLKYYLSKDQYFSSYDDYLLGESSVSTLAINASSAEQGTLAISNSITKGTWYILYVADYYNTLSENNENNNVSFKAIEVLDPLPGDLAFTSTSLSTDTTILGETILANYTIKNKGNGIAGSSNLYVILSRDTIYNSSDIFIKSQEVSQLDVDGSLTSEVGFTIPTNILSGKWYVLFIADALLSVTESNEKNNLTYQYLYTTKAQKPDLTISANSVTPDTTLAGKIIMLSTEIKNIGKGIADTSVVKYYLSLDSTFSSSDILLGQSNLYNLEAKDLTTFTTEVTIPANTNNGNWYILYIADADLALIEALETNNSAFSTLNIEKPKFADLTISSISVTKNVLDPNGIASLTAKIKNNGDGDASSSYVQYYLSKDNVYTSGDVYLGNEYIYSIASKDSTIITTQLTIPSGTSSGAWYLIAVADGKLQIVETVEDNNTKAIAISVNPPKRPDLTIASSSLSDNNISAGDALTMTATISNIDTGTASTNYLYYYLSKDNALSSDDIYLSYSYVNQLAFNAQVTQESTVTIPTTIGIGQWYVIFVADAGNYVNEKNENNNVSFKSLWINEPPKPDLTVSNLKTDLDSVVAGTNIVISSDVKNIDLGTANQSTLKYYISKDAVFSTSDTYLSSVSIKSLVASDSAHISNIITVPSNLMKGGWFILAIADADLLVNESIENNNISFKKIYVKQAPIPAKADLVVSTKGVSPSSVDAGQAVLVTSSILNKGLGNAVSSSVKYYLSLDSTWSSSDIILGTDAVTALKAGDITSLSNGNIIIPENVIDGKWYVIIKADAAFEVFESNENNNIASVAITVTHPLPVDLTIINQSVNLIEAAVNGSIFIACMVTNMEDGTAGKSVLHYYLSKDTLYSSSDILLDIDSTKSIVGGSKRLQSASPRIPSVNGGDYYVLFVADAANQVKESNENNNVKYVALKVNGPIYSDLIVSNQSIATNTISGGSNATVSCLLKNTDEGAADASQLKYYLSKDATYNSSDLLLATDSIGILNGKSNININKDLFISTSISAGSWYIIFVADANNDVDENTNENNNTASIAITVAAPLTNDLEVVYNTANYTSVKVGDEISVSCYIKNNGTGTVQDASKLNYYLSTDATFSSSDLLIDSADVSSIAAGSMIYKSTSFTVPTIATGTWYILLVADASSNIVESNEANNVKSIQISISTTTTKADLILTSAATYPSTIESGSETTLGLTIKNQGDGKAGSFAIGYYLSKDSIYGSGDIYLSSSTISSLLASASTYNYASITIPTGTTAGDWYIVANADANMSIVESNENNNITFTSIKVTQALPNDLTVVSQSVSTTSVRASDLIYASAGVKNIGEGQAAASVLYYYISKDSILNYGDISLSYSYIESVASNAINFKSIALTMPSTLDTGTYYILFVADANNAVSETNENNNIANTTVKVLAPLPVDLTILESSVNPTNIEAGLTSTVNCTVKNTAEGIVLASSVKYYLSNDNTKSADDVLLATSSTGTITGGSSVALSTSILIPETAATGNKFILFVADADAVLTESNETNNVSAIAVKIETPLPKDLTITNLTISNTSIAVAEELLITHSVKNIEQGTAGYSYTQYYLSTDTIVSTGDVSLGSKYISSLNSGASSYNSISYRIPCGTVAGSYYILAVADANSNVNESIETNNTAYKAITITSASGVDLTLVNSTINPTNPEIGFAVSISSTVKNLGTSAACPSTVKYYLSKDLIVDATDVVLSTSSISYVNSLATNAASAYVNIPDATTAGSYNVIIVADGDKSITETDETNNQVNIAVTISKPLPSDLTVLNQTLSLSNINAGSTAAVSYTVKNIGTGPAKNSYVYLYLSADSISSKDDVYLTSNYISSLAVGSSSYQYANITIPTTTNLGAWYILAVADAENLNTESNETNNTANNKITVEEALLPDLLFTDAQIDPYVILKGESTHATSIVKNAGKYYASGSTVQYYLSANNKLDSLDTYLGTTFTTGLSVGDSTTQSLTLTLPSTISTSDMYILFVADGYTYIKESDEINNITAVKLVVKETSLPDYVVDELNTTDSVYNGTTLNVSCSIANHGVGTGSIASIVKYYLSADSLYNTDDVYLNESSVKGLIKGAVDNLNITCSIPANTVEGNWYVVFVADASSLIIEDNETNNVNAIKVFVKQTPLPDYVVEKLVAADSTLGGSTINVACTIANNGIGAASVASIVKYYLSTDSLYSTSDVSLGEATVIALDKGATDKLDLICNIPANTEIGKWYIVFVVDESSLITEDNEANNVSAVKFNVYGNTGIEKVQSSKYLSVYPNPTTDIIYLNMHNLGPNLQVSITDEVGRILYSENITETDNATPSINLSQFSNGIYFINIDNGSSKWMKKIVKN